MVVLVARRLELLEQVSSVIEEKGGRALVKVADVTDKEQVKSMGRWVREEVGLPTILVNNAGMAKKAEFAALKPEDWEPTIDFKGGLFCIGEFLADMKEAKKGHIVTPLPKSFPMPKVGYLNKFKRPHPLRNMLGWDISSNLKSQITAHRPAKWPPARKQKLSKVTLGNGGLMIPSV